MPTVIGNKKTDLEKDVVYVDIPLPLSKAALKNAQTVLDFIKDTVTMFGQEQLLLRTSPGHCAILICPARLEIENGESKIT